MSVKIVNDACDTYHRPGKAINSWTSNFIDPVCTAARACEKRYFRDERRADKPRCIINHQKTTVLIGLHKVYNGVRSTLTSRTWTSTISRTVRTLSTGRGLGSRRSGPTPGESGCATTPPGPRAARRYGHTVPLPPHVPWSLAASSSTTPRITWHGGQWAHKYDVNIGRGSCGSPCSAIIAGRNLSTPTSNFYQSFDWTSSNAEIGEWYQVTAPLAASTGHYVRITSKTAAGQSRSACLTFTIPESESGYQSSGVRPAEGDR